MRKVISVLLGACLFLAGLFALGDMALYSGPVSLAIWTTPIASIALGLALLWEDLGPIVKRGEDDR